MLRDSLILMSRSQIRSIMQVWDVTHAPVHRQTCTDTLPYMVKQRLKMIISAFVWSRKVTNLLPVYHFIIKASFYVSNAPSAHFKRSRSSSSTSVSPQQLKESLSGRSEHDKCLYSGAPTEIVLKRKMHLHLSRLTLNLASCCTPPSVKAARNKRTIHPPSRLQVNKDRCSWTHWQTPFTSKYTHNRMQLFASSHHHCHSD